jgi:hypothetical protein
MMATAVPEDVADLMRSVAERILRDLAEIARTRPALSHEIRDLVVRRGLTVTLTTHEPFDALYPVHEIHADIHEEQRVFLNAAQKAAAALLAEGRDNAIEKLLACEREAATLKHLWPRLTPDACVWIAERVPDPLVWGEQLAAGAAPGDLVFPYLDEARKRGDAGWIQAAGSMLSQTSTRGAAIKAILTDNTVPDDTVSAAVRFGSEWEMLIRGLAAGGLLSDAAIAACLSAEDAHLASSVAGALFYSRPSISSDPKWRAAILRASPEADEIVQALRADSSLALDWLVATFGRSDEHTRWYHEHVIEEAISVLSKEQRMDLVRAIPEAWFMRDIVSDIVGNDPEIFRVLLGQTHLSDWIRLAPLNGMPNRPEWATLALTALDHGVSVEDVHDACHGNGWSWHGSESSMWQSWVDAFAALAKHPDPRLQQVARIGMERTVRQRDAARVRERAEAVHGY